MNYLRLLGIAVLFVFVGLGTVGGCGGSGGGDGDGNGNGDNGNGNGDGMSERFEFMFGSAGDGAGQFNSPFGIAVDSMKNIYVADSRNHRIQVFDSAGNFLFMFGWGVDDGTSEFQICTSADTPCQAGINGNGVGQFDFPVGIAVDSMKNIYVAELSNHRIQVFSQPQE